MKLKAKLVKKYQQEKSTNPATGIEFRHQQIEFEILNDKEPNDFLLAYVFDPKLLDNESLSVGVTGILSVGMFVEGTEGRMKQRVIMNDWEEL